MRKKNDATYPVILDVNPLSLWSASNSSRGHPRRLRFVRDRISVSRIEINRIKKKKRKRSSRERDQFVFVSSLEFSLDRFLLFTVDKAVGKSRASSLRWLAERFLTNLDPSLTAEAELPSPSIDCRKDEGIILSGENKSKSFLFSKRKGWTARSIPRSSLRRLNPPRVILTSSLWFLISALLRQSMSPVADTLIGSSKSSVSQPIIDYSRYVRRYTSGQECGSSYCKELGCREHFHCLDCSGRVFVKKEEMIRHFKWHKKRDESLQHGFMRYSPTDDCSERHPGRACPHNRKQTHYHCIHENCDKVYISTSDVQMHANYHRKDSAIIQEGFQRFRATESCATDHCPFVGQRTTHFHCRRPGCRFTFKNKADMGKELLAVLPLLEII